MLIGKMNTHAFPSFHSNSSPYEVFWDVVHGERSVTESLLAISLDEGGPGAGPVTRTALCTIVTVEAEGDIFFLRKQSASCSTQLTPTQVVP